MAEQRERVLEVSFICEPGRRPFATEDAARNAAATAEPRFPGVRWDFPQSDGGYFAVAYHN